MKARLYKCTHINRLLLRCLVTPPLRSSPNQTFYCHCTLKCKFMFMRVYLFASCELMFFFNYYYLRLWQYTYIDRPNWSVALTFIFNIHMGMSTVYFRFSSESCIPRGTQCLSPVQVLPLYTLNV